MVSMRNRRDLFGGTLRCAGVAGAAVLSSTAAADFGFSSGLSYVIVAAQDATGTWFGNYEEDNGIPFLNLSHAYTGWAGTAFVNTTTMEASISEFDPGLWSHAYSEIGHWVSTAGKPFRLEWDLAGAVGGSAWVYHYQSANVILNMSLGDSAGMPSGSIVLNLDPGSYFIRLSIAVNQEDSEPGYVRLTNIPAPGAAALLGFGMLGINRRRRA